MSISSLVPAPYTLEVTGKACDEVRRARDVIPPATPINIAFLGNEDHAQRIEAARIIRECGFEPVPIISSRRLRSVEDRDHLLGALVEVAAPTRFILVGGDPATPAGPFQDSLALLSSGVLTRHGIRHVGITGYPEGHPKIADDALWRALRWKLDFLHDAGCSVEITTQLGFDAEAALRWIGQVRGGGIDVPIRIGLPGPTDVGRLLRYARQFGVSTSAGILKRYGLSMTNLLKRVGAERYLQQLQTGIEARELGAVHWHLYPFGGMLEAVEWMNQRLSTSLQKQPVL
ncbi:methylenetetrahydrofolate reductase [Pseudomonas sp. LRF_L74]|uniref:methylenetetrahydrofolate reductase n=1 Tax=Pseudomonas sp. LRF_L74 TaxID=3369422 RepID=UPI003F5EFCE0